MHRDLKLENVLLNVPQDTVIDSITKNKSLTTLTDFGLSRHIDPEKPMLTTRCGSEDYAPPELIMGQPYDGRQTDAWALGVLLYALVEGRFPFDGPPATVSPDGSIITPGGSSGNRRSSARSRVKHRIARIEWGWVRLLRESSLNGEEYQSSTSIGTSASTSTATTEDGENWKSAKEVVEKCLQRRETRATVSEIADSDYIKGALKGVDLCR